MVQQKNTQILKDTLRADGACLVGFADVSILGLTITREYPFGICFTLRHDNEAVNKLPNDEPWLQMASSLTQKAGNMYRVVQDLIESCVYHYMRISSTTRYDELPDPGEELLSDISHRLTIVSKVLAIVQYRPPFYK